MTQMEEFKIYTITFLHYGGFSYDEPWSSVYCVKSDNIQKIYRHAIILSEPGVENFESYLKKVDRFYEDEFKDNDIDFADDGYLTDNSKIFEEAFKYLFTPRAGIQKNNEYFVSCEIEEWDPEII